jgi:hypothetical protein
MSLVAQFVSHAAQVFSAGSSSKFLTAVPLEPSHPFYRPLSDALVSVRLLVFLLSLRLWVTDFASGLARSTVGQQIPVAVFGGPAKR